MPSLPSYSFPFPALLSEASGRRPLLYRGPAWKFRTAYSDELASDSHGIPRYATRPHSLGMALRFGVSALS